MKKILVPTNFSPIADKALEIAVAIAAKHGATIDLLNVNVFPSAEIGVYYSVYSSVQSIDETWQAILSDAEHQVQERIARYPSVSIKALVEESNHNLAYELLHHETDLIVMGSYGAEGMKELLKGSNSEEIVRLANCPVLVVKDEAYVFDLKRIVLALDLSNHTETVKKAIDMLPVQDAEVHFLFIDDDMKVINYAETNAKLSGLASSLNIDNFVTAVHEAKSVDEGIIEYAENVDANLIVMYTHGRTGLSHFFRGSIAEDVVNHTKVPVFTFVEK